MAYWKLQIIVGLLQFCGDSNGSNGYPDAADSYRTLHLDVRSETLYCILFTVT